MTKNTVEYWRYIPGYNFRYQVSGNGLVRRLKITDSGVEYRAMKQTLNKVTGYLTVSLSRDGVAKSQYVHRLVLLSFIGTPRPGMLCCHNDGNPANNRLDNLRWDTQKSNCEDRRIHAELRGKTWRSPLNECKRGHRFVEANVYKRRDAKSTDGWARTCRACMNARTRAYQKNVALTDAMYAEEYEKIMARASV